MKYEAGKIDVAVIGAGHAGIEAGLAAARLGCKTEIFTINLDWVGNMPCNPSIGGTLNIGGNLADEVQLYYKGVCAACAEKKQNIINIINKTNK